MLFVKRLLTALVTLGVLFIVFYHGSVIVGAIVVGVRVGVQQRAAGNHDHAATVRLGTQAGRQLMADYGQTIGLASLALATVGALWLSFGGALPWCRDVASPSLPGKRFG